MSWLVVLAKLPDAFASVSDIPDDFVPEPLGSRAAVLMILAEVFPDADFTDYTHIHAENCDCNADGDMLLFQWGTYNWGGTDEWFEYNITRQFIFPHADAAEAEREVDDCIWQLSLTLKFIPIPELKQIAAGNKWCPH